VDFPAKYDLTMTETSRLESLVQQLKWLRSSAKIMVVGAHPHDDRRGLLSYLSQQYDCPVHYWSATRGESEREAGYTGDAQGIYQTWKCLADCERKYIKVSFGPFYDFGISKHAEDTFAKWGKKNVVRELVRAIRLQKPALIISLWQGDPSDGHGHHEAIGLAVKEAFDAAGDPDKFPGLAKDGCFVWQPVKLYHCTEASANILSGQEDQDVTAPPLSTEDDFWACYTLHKSRSDGSSRKKDLLAGVDPALTGLADRVDDPAAHDLRQHLKAGLKGVDQALAQLQSRPDSFSETGQRLLKALASVKQAAHLLRDMDTDPRVKQSIGAYLFEKIVDFERTIAICLGLELNASGNVSETMPGQLLTVDCRLDNREDTAIDDIDLSLEIPEGWDSQLVETGPKKNGACAAFEVRTAKDAPYSCPYWLRSPRIDYMYTWPEGGPWGQPFNIPDIHAVCHCVLAGQTLTLRIPVVCGQNNVTYSQRNFLKIIPPLTLRTETLHTFRAVSEHIQRLEIQVTAQNNTLGAISGIMSLDLPEGWGSDPRSTSVSIPRPGATKTVSFQVSIPAFSPQQTYTLGCKVVSGVREYTHSVIPVCLVEPECQADKESSSKVNIVTPSEVKISLIRVELAENQNYGYVPGENDDIIDALTPLGISFTELSKSRIGYSDLNLYDVIVIAPNAYLLSEDLHNNAQQFLDYVKAGGTLIVQYQGYDYQDKGFTPYSFSYNHPYDGVAAEDAKVTVLDPEHKVFRFPNQIDETDFEGWVQDRGLYFFGSWDDPYQPLLACADPGEPVQKGGLLTSKYGRGNFIYTGYSFFRQCPAGVPGAFRLFANLLALPAASLRERMDFLHNTEIFAQFDDSHLESLARIMIKRWEDNGAIICKEGETGNELYFVYGGEIEVIKGDDIRENIVATLGVGACVGEMAILGHIPRTATLRAKGDVQLLVIRGDHFQSLLLDNPQMAIGLLNMLVVRFAAK